MTGSASACRGSSAASDEDRRRLRLVDVADEAARDRQARADELLHALAARGREHELVAFEDADRARVGAEQRRRVLDDLLEHGVGIELGGEQAARARELLRERACAPLRLVEVAAAEGAARDVRELPGELEVVVGEAALLGEADEDDAVALGAS